MKIKHLRKSNWSEGSYSHSINLPNANVLINGEASTRDKQLRSNHLLSMSTYISRVINGFERNQMVWKLASRDQPATFPVEINVGVKAPLETRIKEDTFRITFCHWPVFCLTAKKCLRWKPLFIVKPILRSARLTDIFFDFRILWKNGVPKLLTILYYFNFALSQALLFFNC